MATKTKKRKLIADPSVSQELETFANLYIPDSIKDRFLEQVRLTGQVPLDILNERTNMSKGDRERILSEIPRITGGKPLDRALGKGEIAEELNPKKPTDEASLTDEELASRRDLYSQLGETSGDLGGYYGTIKEAVDSKLKAYGVTGPNNIGDVITKIIQRGGYPDADSLRSQLREFGVRIDNPALQNFINDQNVRNELGSLAQGITEKTDTSEDVKRIEDVLADRGESRKRESDIEGFISELPNELAGPRNERIKMLRELRGRQFDAQAPGLIARENALGRFNTGAVGDALSTSYNDITANVESEAARLMSEDDAFIFNAAYQNQIRKLIEGRVDLGASLATERQNVRTQQEARFQNTQFDLNKNLENDLLMQKYEASIASAQRARQRQQDYARNANRNAMFGQAGGAATAIGAGAGFLIGGPGGAAVGAGAGAGVGVGLPLLFGRK